MVDRVPASFNLASSPPPPFLPFFSSLFPSFPLPSSTWTWTFEKGKKDLSGCQRLIDTFTILYLFVPASSLRSLPPSPLSSVVSVPIYRLFVVHRPPSIMKLAAALLTAAAGVVLAQDFSGIPACAVCIMIALGSLVFLLNTDVSFLHEQTSCLASAIGAAGCGASDLSCQCGTGQPAIVATVAPCLVAACNLADLGQAQSAGLARCAAFSATATATSTGSGTTTGTGTATSTSGSGSSTGTGSSASSTGSTSSGATSSTRPSSTMPPATTTRPASTTTRSAVSSSSNAAAVQTGLGAGMMVAIMGAMAAL